ncbi:sensor histidine kinase [Halomonas sp. A40-4]|uniref:ATP-binding protein n=1 Tax=unclassified Halomonas TaxID=2609666 RepID=UPI000A285482|nr:MULTISPECIES: ATP-binding protein [unclassified Halomonas]QPL47071.1 sensor histidine kinase [Halomonas sp. A40-4]
MRSIRRYLLRTLAITLVVAGGIAVTAAYLITDHELEEILDTQLSLHSRIVAGQLDPDATIDDYARLASRMGFPEYPAQLYRDGNKVPVSSSESGTKLYHEEELKLVLGFWNSDGSPRLLGGKWKDAGPFPAPFEEGFRWENYDGHRWRVFSMFDVASDTWISMGLRGSFHDEVVERITWNNLLPMLFLLPLLLWLMSRIIRRGIAPIQALSSQVQGRSANDLRKIDNPVPQELIELRQSLNDFIARLKATLERERRFTADAAHELRTPLAALRIHLDNAQAGGDQSLQKAYVGVERLQRVVEQLLILARLDQVATASRATIDLYPIIAELVAELWPLAEDRDQHLKLTGLTRLEVRADDVEVGILFRNLLDNALRYTPKGGQVEVELALWEGLPQLIVRDTGPGLPDALLEKVTERFRRASGQGTTGSGLGLSIVSELVQRQQATLTLSNREPSGLEVSVRWELPT